LGQFGPVFGAHFPNFPTFTVSPHGILARRIAPCTIAHRKSIVRQDVRPQPMSKNSFWEHQLAHFGHSFTLPGIGVVAPRKCSLRLTQIEAAPPFGDHLLAFFNEAGIFDRSP
jgi:hypothetical protein